MELKPKSLVVLTIAAVLMGGAALAQEERPLEQMQSRVDRLEQEIRSLREALGETRSNAQARQESLEREIKQLRRALHETHPESLVEKEVDELLRHLHVDAQAHEGPGESGLTAGWDGADFFVGSRDGNFLLQIGGRVQTRFEYSHQDDSPDVDKDGNPDPGVGDDDRWGFEVRRLKLDFWGHVVDPSWLYYVQIASDDKNRDIALDDAYVEKVFDGGWRLRMGQFKPPFMQEDLVSSRFMVAAERSLINEEFSQRDRSIGIQLAHYGERFRFRLMLNNGFGNTNNPALDYDTEIGVSGRVDLRALGEWKQFKDYSSWSDEKTALMIGAGFHYERDENGTSAPGGVDGELETVSVTADLTLKIHRASLFAAGVYRHRDNGADFDQFGVVVQAAYFLVPDTWEGFLRWEYGDLDMGGDELNTLTIGFDRYFKKHRIKLTVDVGYGFNGVAAGFDAAQSTGWRQDSDGSDGQIVFRVQFQLLF